MNYWDYFEHYNRWRKINRLFQIVLAVSFIVELNYLSGHYFVRWDTTVQNHYSLSAETNAYIQSIDVKDPITITVALTPSHFNQYEKQLFRYVKNLLKAYEYEGRSGRDKKIEVRFVNLFQDRTEAESLRSQYNITESRIILLENNTQHRILLESDIIKVKDNEMVAFVGEHAITKTIVEIIQSEKPNLYFTIGHGEMRLDDTSPLRGLSQLRQQLELRNFNLMVIDLSEEKRIPDDASLLVIAAPQGPFRGEEIAEIRRYLGLQAGRVILYTNPGYKHGLDELLFDWNIRTDDMVIIDRSWNNITRQGDLRIRNFTRHAITDQLIDNEVSVEVGLVQPVNQDLEAPADERLEIKPLIYSSENSWAERAWRSPVTPSYDNLTDFKGAVSIAAISERKGSAELGLDIPGGRLLVFGSGDFIANYRISSLGNYYLLYNTINWSTNEKALKGILPRKIEQIQFSFSRQQQWHVVLLFLLLPCSLAFIGLFVFLLRR